MDSDERSGARLLVSATEAVSRESVEEVVRVCSEAVAVEVHGMIMLRAWEVPAIISLAGRLKDWAPLVGFAKAFLERLRDRVAERAADSVLARGKKDPRATERMDAIGGALEAAVTRGRGSGRIVELTVEPEQDGARVTAEVHPEGPDDMTLRFALFLTLAPKVMEVAKSAKLRGEGPFGDVRMHLDKTGACTIEWIRADMREFKAEVSDGESAAT